MTSYIFTSIMNIILCGYHWTGCEVLRILTERIDIDDIFVYTHSNPWYVPSLEKYCEKLGINYSLEKIVPKNIPFKPDVIISIYYRYIISEEVITLVDGKIFNLHPSLLPKYRGTGSLTWAMINGEENAGFTYHYINKNIDQGNIILQKPIPIREFDTQETLYQRVMVKSIEYFDEVFDKVISGYIGTPQPPVGMIYKRGPPFEGEINENWSNSKIERFIRAMINPPLPVAKHKGKNIFSFDDFTEHKNKGD